MADVIHEPVRLATGDGEDLQAEWAIPPDPTAVIVMCHPHPLYGGSMDAHVVTAVFRALPRAGVAVLRFNFRGAGSSTGSHGEGRAERADVVAAIEAAGARFPGLPLVIGGYSFGAEVALTVDHPSIAAWALVAPPLAIVDAADRVALTDPRPKRLIVAAHDQFASPAEVATRTAEAVNTSITEVPGADHFFAVGLDTIVAEVTAAVGN